MQKADLVRAMFARIARCYDFMNRQLFHLYFYRLVPLLGRVLVGQEVLTRGTFLYDEVRFLLQQELREPRNYFAILEAIASGRTRLNEIKQATGLSGVTAYLDTLQGLQLVERVVPVTESQPHKSRRGLYRLRDHFFRFWFRFVHPNRTLLERGGAQVALDTLVAPQLDSFTGPIFAPEVEEEAAQRDDLFLFDLPRIVTGDVD